MSPNALRLLRPTRLSARGMERGSGDWARSGSNCWAAKISSLCVRRIPHHRNRPERGGRSQATPSHRVQTIHSPASRHDHREFLQPLRKDERRHLCAAQHHHKQGRHDGVAAGGLQGFDRRSDHQAEGSRHQRESGASSSIAGTASSMTAESGCACLQ